VNRTLLRISPILNAPRIVEITSPLLLYDLARPACRFDLLARGPAEAVGVDCERLGDRALGQDLHRHRFAGGKTLGPQLVQGDRGARLKARLEIDEIDRLGLGPERLERHRLLHMRTAQLAHPHVNRVLAALEPVSLLGARARAPAFLAAAGGLAGARALAAANALARAARARSGTEVMKADSLRLLIAHADRLRSASSLACRSAA